MIAVGKVLKAHGVKGQLKLSCYLDNVGMLCKIPTLHLKGVAYKVTSSFAMGEFCIVALKGIDERNVAEGFKDCEVFAEKADVKKDDDRYFIEDVIGCEVYLDAGDYVGKVAEVEQYGAADVYTTSDGKRTVSFPLLKDLVVSFNVEGKLIILKKQRFIQVAVQQDEN